MSILFHVEGSPLSKIAGDMSIGLARKFETEIIAQFIIDPQKIFDLEGFEGVAGLCGNGPFIETEQDIIPPLMSLGESLLMAFAALAEGQDIYVHQFVDIGEPAQEMAQRGEHNHFMMLAGSEENFPLAHMVTMALPSLILLVQSEADVLLIEPADVDHNILSALRSHLTDMSIRFEGYLAEKPRL